MAAAGEGSRPGFDPAQILYGPPLPPVGGSEARAPERSWGEHYIFDTEITERIYVVAEEVVDDYVVIVVSPWPRVDESGGLEFPPEEERREALVDRASFQERLADRDVIAYPNAPLDNRAALLENRAALQNRPIATGDVFAIEADLPEGHADLREAGSSWIRGRITDVTAMARDAAKAAMFAALAGEPLSVDEAEAIAEAEAERPERPPPATPA